MNHKHQPFGPNQSPAQSVFMSSVEGASSVIAVIVTFFVTPLAYNRTIDFVQRFAAAQYGPGFDEIIVYAWMTTIGLLTFFLARGSVGVAITMGGLAIAARFL